MAAKKRSPRPQLRRWIRQFEEAFEQHKAEYAEWKRRFADDDRPEPQPPKYKDMVLIPLAEFINRHAFHGKGVVEVFGPQGICCRYTLDIAYRGRVYYLGLEPEFREDLPMMRVRRFDKKPSEEYSKDSIGEMNCLNYPTTPVNQAEPADWWRKIMCITREE